MSSESDDFAEHALECTCDNYVCPDPIRIKELKMSKSHPWGDFLDARVRAIEWMHTDMGYEDYQIARALSMDETQVNLIRTYHSK